MYSRTRLLLIAAAATIVATVAWLAAWMIDAYYQDAMHMAFRVDLACSGTQDAYYCDEVSIATNYMDAQDFIPSTIMDGVLWTGGVIAIAVALWALDSVVKQTRVGWAVRRAVAEQREHAMLSRLRDAELRLDGSRATTALLMRTS